MSTRRAKARDTALDALCDRAGNVTAHLNRILAENPLEPHESGLARELALGVVRRRRTLDTVIDAFRRGGREPPVRTREILRLGVYQLLFLDRVPEFAAVDEAVRQVRGGERLRGFVNALLRGVARSVSPPMPGRPTPGPNVLPLSAESFRRLDRPVFADPADEPARYLGEALSLPDELARRWLKRFEDLGGSVMVALHANARPPLLLRVNSLRADVAEVLRRLRAAGAEAVAHANGLSVAVAGHVNLAQLDVFVDGLVQPQDASATSVAASCGVRPGMRVLDLCAAPGTKTTHLAELMQDRGEIVAVDVNREKLARIEENCGRMGVSIVRTVLADQVASLAGEPFDLVLVDAPCSNTGVLARRVEARWRFSLKALRALAADQRRLLDLGSRMVRPGGLCVYSTCSLEAEENEIVVREMLARRREFELVAGRSILPAGADEPARWRDGGYFAVLRRHVRPGSGQMRVR